MGDEGSHVPSIGGGAEDVLRGKEDIQDGIGPRLERRHLPPVSISKSRSEAVSPVQYAVICSTAFSLLAIAAFNRRANKKRTAIWGDGSDEMFEAMREVDALTPSVEPFLAARLPPRPDENTWCGRYVAAYPDRIEEYEIEFDPMTGRTKRI